MSICIDTSRYKQILLITLIMPIKYNLKGFILAPVTDFVLADSDLLLHDKNVKGSTKAPAGIAFNEAINK